MSSPSQKWLSLQALRFLAVLLVLWAHVKYTVAVEYKGGWVESAFGSFGVDLFFVISGFVISGSADRLRAGPGRFLLQRFIRVVPLYWIFSVPYLFRNWYGGGVTGGQIWNTVFFLPVFDISQFQNPAHPFGWTLSFEVWFYLLFGLGLAVAGYRAIEFMVALLLLGVVGVGAFYGDAWFFPRFAAHPLVMEFVAGCVIYRLRSRLGLLSGCLAVIGCVVILPLALEHQQLGAHNSVLLSEQLGWQRAVIWGSLATCVVVLALSLERRGVSCPTWLALLGDASYSMYLVQPFVLSLVKLLGFHSPAVALIFFMMLSTAVGYFIWQRLELPLTGFLRAKWVPNADKSTAVPVSA